MRPRSSVAGNVSGKESITPLASMNGTKSYATQQNDMGFSYGSAQETMPVSTGNVTLTRRATDTQLLSQGQAQVQARADYSSLRQPRAPSTAIHAPQPQRVSLTIPEPESMDSPPQPAPTAQPQPQTQAQAQFFRSDAVNYGSNAGGYPPANSQVQRSSASAGFYSNTNPSANMSLRHRTKRIAILHQRFVQRAC